jgi:hypothetical protein
MTLNDDKQIVGSGIATYLFGHVITSTIEEAVADPLQAARI